MSSTHVITSQPLPLNQDYRSLKQEGLAYIQEHSGPEWTNLNNADPGVTILDQLCYALTELGYCNDFSVADILTKPDGTLQVKDQFYLPEEMLSTSPVTITDYRKCLIDGVAGVANAVITPLKPSPDKGSRAYQVYLFAAGQVTDESSKEELCKAAYIYLNKWRNLGEQFLKPVVLVNDPHLVKGQIELNEEGQLGEVLVQLQQRLQDYIFPQVRPIAYDKADTGNIPAEELFNGPLLQNGWISSSALSEKKDQLKLAELEQLILHVPGIRSVTHLAFDQQQPCEEIRTTADRLLFMNWSVSLNNGLDIYCKGRKLAVIPFIRSLESDVKNSLNTSLLFSGVHPNSRTVLPRGKYRDISSYYSIQNTFPAIFAVGEDVAVSNASDFQIAQSRQLKGYLTLFDQLLANQFAQLANIGSLFSFRQTLSETPYFTFSPTYYCQPLYTVPYIRPLLKDNRVAGAGNKSDEKSWDAYKLDPYNPYVKGLMDIMEDDMTSLSRRNEIVDHLLARHGESPLLIDAVLNGSSYSGESLKDKVIFKSLYLQNLGLLSYFRQKGYNFLGSQKLSGDLTDVPPDFERRIMAHDPGGLSAQDFMNYSALELKLSLLFGLKVQYGGFIANHYEKAAIAAELRQAMWMIMERRGLLVIETGLLLSCTDIPSACQQVELVFPLFIPQLNTDEFKDRLELFLQENMPLQVSYCCHFVGSEMLEKLIIAYADWHNGLINCFADLKDKDLINNASTLLKLMNKINLENHG